MICSKCEADIEDFDESRPFSIDGYKTLFPFKRTGTNKKRLICFVKACIEAEQRSDLMSELLSNVWLEIQGKNQKVLICAMYREFNDLTCKNPMTIDQQIDRLKILYLQIEQASKEGLILVIGDMNIDLLKWEDRNYYLKKLSEEYQSLIGDNGLEVINFGITWKRHHKDGKNLSSAIDHALTNKLVAINDYHKTFLDYSDHEMISVDMNIKTDKLQGNNITSRDLRKLQSNPDYFLKELAKIKWESFSHMDDIDSMEKFWTKSINECLDYVAPWKTRKFKQKKYCLPKEVQEAIKVREKLRKAYQMNAQYGKEDLKLQLQFKKQRNYCNKVIKNAIKENTGKYITSTSSVKSVWNSVNDILKPNKLAKTSIKIQTEDKMIDDP